MKQRMAAGVTVLVWIAVATLSQACGDDDTNSSGRKTSGEGVSGSGGKGDQAGQGASDAGLDGSVDAMRRPTDAGAVADGSTNDYAYQCQPKVIDPGGSTRQGASCCAGHGECTAANASGPGLPHDSCSAANDLRCSPRPPIPAADSDAGVAINKSCRVQLPGTPAGGPDYEGRCLGACFAQNSPILSRLRQASCEAGELCSPCYNPLTGDSPGTCERGDDAPVEPKPDGFVECGPTQLGYCIPIYAAGAQASELAQLSCGPGELCAPKIKAADPSACFAHCTSVFGPGACVPDFLAGSFASAITQADCASAELCAPCEFLGKRIGVCD